MKPNQEQNNLLSYLEGEIKYEPMGEQIWAIDGEKHTLIADVRGFGRISRMFKTLGESINFQDALGEFVATAIINERERRKGQGKVEPEFEYEMLFKSKEGDFVKIDGWYPISTDRISNPENISNYIENGILRRITPKKEE